MILELCRQLGDPPERCLVLYGLATVHELRGRYQQSEALLQQQLADGPADMEIETFELLACSTFHQGAFDKAVTYASRGLDLYDHEVHSIHLARYGEHPGVSCHAWAGLPLANLVVIAPYLGERARDLIASRGVSYIDTTGNMRLLANQPGRVGGRASVPRRDRRSAPGRRHRAAGRPRPAVGS